MPLCTMLVSSCSDAAKKLCQRSEPDKALDVTEMPSEAPVSEGPSTSKQEKHVVSIRKMNDGASSGCRNNSIEIHEKVTQLPF